MQQSEMGLASEGSRFKYLNDNISGMARNLLFSV